MKDAPSLSIAGDKKPRGGKRPLGERIAELKAAKAAHLERAAAVDQKLTELLAEQSAKAEAIQAAVREAQGLNPSVPLIRTSG